MNYSNENVNGEDCGVEAAICLSPRSEDDDLLAEISIDLNCPNPKCSAKLEAEEECNKKCHESVNDKPPAASICSKLPIKKSCNSFLVRKSEKCGGVCVEQAPKCGENFNGGSSINVPRARESTLSFSSRKPSGVADQSIKSGRKSSKKSAETFERKSSIRSRKSSNFQELISNDGILSCNSQKNSDSQAKKSSIRSKGGDSSCKQVLSLQDDDDIKRSLMSLKDNVNEISRTIRSQSSVSTVADRLVSEIHSMKCQLSELSQAVKSNSVKKSISVKPSVKTNLDKSIDEIKDQLQQLSTIICSVRSSAEYKEANGTKLSCLDSGHKNGSVNKFVLDKVESLKTSIEDAIATEKACNGKINETGKVDRAFEIMQELQEIISRDSCSFNQGRALELLEELQNLLNELDKRSIIISLKGSTEELSHPSSNPVYPSTCPSDSPWHQSSSCQKGSTMSFQGSQLSNLLNERTQKILEELYTELQELNEGIKMRVPSMLGEIVSIMDSLKQPGTERQSCEVDQYGKFQTIAPTPSLCLLVNQIESVIRSVKPDMEIPNCDFGSDFGSFLENLMIVVQSESMDADVLASVRCILLNMENELQKQGAASTPQAECIRELIEMTTIEGIPLQTEEDASIESEPNTYTTTRNSEASEGKIMDILNSIHSCVNEEPRLSVSQRRSSMRPSKSRRSVSSQYCEKSQSIESDNSAMACAEAVNSRVKMILAELRGIVKTLEIEGSSLRDSTVDKVFSIFHQIECILEPDRSNVCLLNEIKEILSHIEEGKMRSSSEVFNSEYSSPKSCSSQRQTINDARNSFSRRTSKLSNQLIENMKDCVNFLRRA